MSSVVTPYEILYGVMAVEGVGVGSVTDRVKGTGVTVVILPEGARGAVDIAGGAPATRETPVLDPTNTIPGPDAVVLSGGSALGLQTADGVANALRELNRGVCVGSARIPIVVAAAIFDMDVGLSEPPTIDDGSRALRMAAQLEQRVEEGRFGAGTGATVGKSLGTAARMNSGQAAVTLKTHDGLIVSALLVVNAVGSILDENGEIIAGPRIDDVPQSTTALWAMATGNFSTGRATTIGLIITNAGLSKSELGRVARMAHDGLGRSIDPVHTPWDGDTLFVASVGDRSEDAGRVGALSAHAVTIAVRRAVKAGIN